MNIDIYSVTNENTGVTNMYLSCNPIYNSNHDFPIESCKSIEINNSCKESLMCKLCDKHTSPGDTVCILSCGHKFHKKCTAKWSELTYELEEINYCPTCSAKYNLYN